MEGGERMLACVRPSLIAPSGDFCAPMRRNQGTPDLPHHDRSREDFQRASLRRKSLRISDLSLDAKKRRERFTQPSLVAVLPKYAGEDRVDVLEVGVKVELRLEFVRAQRLGDLRVGLEEAQEIPLATPHLHGAGLNDPIGVLAR